MAIGGAMLRRGAALVVVALLLFMGAFVPAVQAQSRPPAPAPVPGDGMAVDQGIAYVLVFAALVLTYLIHPLDAFPYNLF